MSEGPKEAVMSVKNRTYFSLILDWLMCINMRLCVKVPGLVLGYCTHDRQIEIPVLIPGGVLNY